MGRTTTVRRVHSRPTFGRHAARSLSGSVLGGRLQRGGEDGWVVGPAYCPAAFFSSSARSVLSQATPSRPKWPYAEVWL